MEEKVHRNIQCKGHVRTADFYQSYLTCVVNFKVSFLPFVIGRFLAVVVNFLYLYDNILWHEVAAGYGGMVRTCVATSNLKTTNTAQGTFWIQQYKLGREMKFISE